MERQNYIVGLMAEGQGFQGEVLEDILCQLGEACMDSISSSLGRLGGRVQEHVSLWDGTEITGMELAEDGRIVLFVPSFPYTRISCAELCTDSLLQLARLLDRRAGALDETNED